MFLITDVILIVLSSYMAYISYKKIIYNKNASMGNFIIMIEYIFLCVPIIMNYLMGIPEYKTVYWYQTFSKSMNSSTIAIIYDIYILCSMCALYFYSLYFDKYKSVKKEYLEMTRSGLFNNKYILRLLIFSPVIYIVITGNIKSYLVYGVASTRGLTESSQNQIFSLLILLSVYAFCYYIFSGVLSKKTILVLLLYSLAIAWLQGKRFIIALMIIMYLFYYIKSDLSFKRRKKLGIIVPILFCMLVVFSYFYLVVIRPLSDTGFQSIYEMLRVDFGRDDVIKFVIDKEFFEKDHILDYSGETMLSTLFTFIPRSIWKTKPYPHYMYLTSKILGLSISNLPAGTTPSWFEMCLANYGYFGFLLGIFSIPFFCMLSDKLKSSSSSIVVLVLIIALLTQSIDAYLIFLFLFIVQFFIRVVFRNKKIVIVWRKHHG